jgi:5-enolpyruvylshikimate-3-phosphate synthase
MSAVILASAVGGEIRGSNLHEVSYPNFLDTISKSGISYEKRVQSIE